MKRLICNYLFPALNSILPLYFLTTLYLDRNSKMRNKLEPEDIVFTLLLGLVIGCIVPALIMASNKLDLSRLYPWLLLNILFYPVSAAAILILCKDKIQERSPIASTVVILLASPLFSGLGMILDLARGWPETYSGIV